MMDFPAAGGRKLGELKVVVTGLCLFTYSSRPETDVFEPHVTGGKMGGGIPSVEYTADMAVLCRNATTTSLRIYER